MAFVVYLLCAIASLICAGILWRAYSRNRTRLLLWSSICFAGIAVNNIILTMDLTLGPTYDLSTLRSLIVMVAMGVYLYGLIWDAV